MDNAGAEPADPTLPSSNRFSAKLRVTKEHGRLSADELAELARERPGADYYLCGPDAYLDAVSNLLRTAGVGEQRIHVEHFTHAGGPIATSEKEEPVDLPGPSTDFLYDSSEKPHARTSDKVVWAATKAVWSVESAMLDDWQVFGRSVNPLNYLGHKLQAVAGVDPPYAPATRPGTTRTLRGAASQMAAADAMQHRSASTHASR